MRTNELAIHVEKWLRQNGGDCFCNQCVATQIGHDAPSVGRALAHLVIVRSEEFRHYRGRCADCGTSALVTRAVPGFAWA